MPARLGTGTPSSRSAVMSRRETSGLREKGLRMRLVICCRWLGVWAVARVREEKKRERG